jgi:hypothetical protein
MMDSGSSNSKNFNNNGKLKMAFTKAVRKKARLRLALTGPSGAGKTMSALRLAKGMGGRIALIDTEHGSASLYADVADFDTLELAAPFSPESYIDAIKAAEASGYDVLIIDSITHEWNGKGGILEIHERECSVTKNSYTAWAKVTPRHNAFIEAILQARLHVIVTMRSKQDFVLVEGKNGKQVPQKVGLAPIQRDGFEYEMTTVLDVGIDGNLAVGSKDRTRLFLREPMVVSEQHGKQLMQWLEAGEDRPVPQTITADDAKWLEAEAAELGVDINAVLSSVGAANISEILAPSFDGIKRRLSVTRKKRKAEETRREEFLVDGMDFVNE